jgi:hypothetical protein
MARSQVAIFVLAAALSCEPVAPLGAHDPGVEIPEAATGGMGGHMAGDPRIIESGGDGGQGVIAPGPDTIQGHVCSVAYPGEAHLEPAAVCCELTPAEQGFRDEAFVFINEARMAHDLPPFETDEALDQTAIAWAMHWSLHWSPTAKDGYPGRDFRPRDVAAACGTTAALIMATDAQDEPRLASGLIDPRFPAQYWENDDNLSAPFLNPDYIRLGIGIYDGLLVGVLGRGEAP